MALPSLLPAVNPVKLRGAVRKFRRYFRLGFEDPRYAQWERDYKWSAHERWAGELGMPRYRELLRRRQFGEVAAAAIRIESRTNLLFSFEKMALRDGVRTAAGARTFAEGLHEVLEGDGGFGAWCRALEALPRRQTRVLTWPAATVFPFLAEPETHFFLKPRVTTLAAERCGVPLAYESKPSAAAYSQVLDFAQAVRAALEDYELRPRDMIDVQSFLWVQGSDEYP